MGASATALCLCLASTLAVFSTNSASVDSAAENGPRGAASQSAPSSSAESRNSYTYLLATDGLADMAGEGGIEVRVAPDRNVHLSVEEFDPFLPGERKVATRGADGQ